MDCYRNNQMIYTSNKEVYTLILLYKLVKCVIWICRSHISTGCLEWENPGSMELWKSKRGRATSSCRSCPRSMPSGWGASSLRRTSSRYTLWMKSITPPTWVKQINYHFSIYYVIDNNCNGYDHIRWGRKYILLYLDCL